MINCCENRQFGHFNVSMLYPSCGAANGSADCIAQAARATVALWRRRYSITVAVTE
jgi:hypothetical protein